MIKLIKMMVKPSVPFTTRIIPKMKTMIPITALINQSFFQKNSTISIRVKMVINHNTVSEKSVTYKSEISLMVIISM